MTWRSLLQVVARRIVFGTDSPERATGNSTSDDHPSFREVEVGTWPDTRADSLERTLDRAESVLDGQLTHLADTHDKAVRTVRIEVILFGAVASGSQFVSGGVPVNGWTKLGSVLVVGSIVAGIFTFSSSSPDYGPGPSYVRSNFESGDTNEGVYLELLQGYQEAISNNRRIVNDSSWYMFVTQLLLVAGIVAGSIGILVF